jgi:hypothetical protein
VCPAAPALPTAVRERVTEEKEKARKGRKGGIE